MATMIVSSITHESNFSAVCPRPEILATSITSVISTSVISTSIAGTSITSTSIVVAIVLLTLLLLTTTAPVAEADEPATGPVSSMVPPRGSIGNGPTVPILLVLDDEVRSSTELDRSRDEPIREPTRGAGS